MSDRRVKSLKARLVQHDARVARIEQASGPERRSGEKQGEYRERVRRHDVTQANQIALKAAHRGVLERRLAKAQS
jgi:hypothetical protein